VATLTATAQDFVQAGFTPAAGAQFIFRTFRIDPSGVTSTRPWRVDADSSGGFTTSIPDALPTNSLQILSTLRGWAPIWFAGYPSNVSISELLTATNPDGSYKYIVDPDSMTSAPNPGSGWDNALNALRAEVEQELAEMQEQIDNIDPSAPGAGDLGIDHIQSTPLATWTIPHELTRRPNVSIYSTSGEEVEADVSASLTQVSISFPAPFAGSAVLN